VAPAHSTSSSIKIKDGEFHYFQKDIPVPTYKGSKLIESDGKLWIADTVLFNSIFFPWGGHERQHPGYIQGRFQEQRLFLYDKG